MLTEQEVNLRRQAIDEKLAAGVLLDTEDIWFMGEHMTLDELTNHPAAYDPYFRRLYIHYHNGPQPISGDLSELHLNNLKVMVHEWLDQQQHGDFLEGSLEWASQKETNQELVALWKKWHQAPETSEAEKDEDLFMLISWSKFRFVLARRIFELDIKADHYSLHLNGIELRFDFETALHILSRHFAHGMKPYESIKDHFYGVFAHDQLHLDFQRIFSVIDESGLFAGQDARNINFRYKGVIYKIWSHRIGETGTRFRISTFFPVSSPKRLAELVENYDETPVNEELTVFIKT